MPAASNDGGNGTESGHCGNRRFHHWRCRSRLRPDHPPGTMRRSWCRTGIASASLSLASSLISASPG